MDKPGNASPRPAALPVILTAAVLVGLTAGGGAVVFRGLIGLFHNLLFLGRFGFGYDANQHTPAGPWGPWVAIAPVLGAVGVAFLVKTFAPEAKGHGVPEVIDAVHFREGRIRPAVAAVKSLASALSIGSGGSVGREGPIVQIGAAFGSTVGQCLPMTTEQRCALVTAGAAGGIAATFNTPVAGLLFAVELIVPAWSATTLLPVALATVAATLVGQWAYGTRPVFEQAALAASADSPGNPAEYLVYAPFAVLVGVLAAAFVRGLYWVEDAFEALPGNYYSRHMLGMLLVGLILLAFLHFTGHFYVEGVGYATIGDVLHARLTAPGFLLLLAGARLLVTFLTLGSGASGGVFSPCLFMGGTFGGACGHAAAGLLPGLGLSPTTFALVGMAAMVGASTGAVLTVTVMIFELTGDYRAVLPVIFGVAVAWHTRRTIVPHSVYTLKLFRRGHLVEEGLRHPATDRIY
jgi:chloride channel protein, CIC family